MFLVSICIVTQTISYNPNRGFTLIATESLDNSIWLLEDSIWMHQIRLGFDLK